jgi:hypothetical protein
MPRGQWKLMQEVSRMGMDSCCFMDWFCYDGGKADQHDTWTGWNISHSNTMWLPISSLRMVSQFVLTLSSYILQVLSFRLCFSQISITLTREVFIEEIDMQLLQYFLQYLYLYFLSLNKKESFQPHQTCAWKVFILQIPKVICSMSKNG